MAQQQGLNHTETNTSLTPAQTQIGEDVRDGVCSACSYKSYAINETNAGCVCTIIKEDANSLDFFSYYIFLIIYYIAAGLIFIALIKYCYPQHCKNVSQIPTLAQRIVCYFLAVPILIKKLLKKIFCPLIILWKFSYNIYEAHFLRKQKQKKEEKEYIYIEPERRVSDFFKNKLNANKTDPKQFEIINILFNLCWIGGILFLILYYLIHISNGDVNSKSNIVIALNFTVFAIAMFYAETRRLYTNEKKEFLLYGNKIYFFLVFPLIIYITMLLFFDFEPFKFNISLDLNTYIIQLVFLFLGLLYGFLKRS